MDTKFQKFLNFFVITYACWTAYTHFNVYINNSFTDLITYSPILLLLIGLLLFYYSKSENPHLSAQSAKSEHGSHANPKTHSWIIATTLIAVACRALGFIWLFWFLALIGLAVFTVIIFKETVITDETRSTSGANDSRGVLFLILFVAAIASFSNSPSGDDAYYVNTAITALEHRDLTLLYFDGIHGDLSVPTTHISHRAQTYELLVAFLAAFSPFSVKDIYYIIAPILFSILFVCTNYLLCAALTNRRKVASLYILVFMLLLWGDSRASIGNFSITKLFLGKVVLVNIFIPALVYYCICFVRQPSSRNYFLLFLCVIGATGISSTGIIAAPVALGMIAGTSVLATNSWHLLPRLAALIAYPSAIAFLVKSEIDLRGELAEGQLKEIDMVLGNQVHIAITLVFVLLLPFLLSKTEKGIHLRIATVYTLACTFFLFSPWLGELIGTLTFRAMSWRVLWTIPIPLLVAIGFSQSGDFLFGSRPILRRCYFLLFCILLTLTGSFVLSPTSDRNVFPELGYKHNAQIRESVEKILQCADEEDVLLARSPVSGVMATYTGRPRIIAFRVYYLTSQRQYRPEEDYEGRLKLFDFVNNRKGSTRTEISSLLRKFEVSFVAVPFSSDNVKWGSRIEIQLREDGYRLWATSGNSRIWTNKPC